MSGLDPEANAIAFRLREHWPRDRPVLFHGTRYASAILAEDCLRASDLGTMHLSLTRRPEVAVYWAMLPRDRGCDDYGTVFVLDRRFLQSRYRLHPFRDVVWDEQAGSGRLFHDEAEEAICQDVEALSRFVIGCVQIDHRLSA